MRLIMAGSGFLTDVIKLLLVIRHRVRRQK